MEALLQAGMNSLPQLGGSAALAWFVILLLRREGTALERERKAHDEDLAARDAEITSLRGRVRELDAEVDEQRRLRRAAEDAIPRRHRAYEAG